MAMNLAMKQIADPYRSRMFRMAVKPIGVIGPNQPTCSLFCSQFSTELQRRLQFDAIAVVFFPHESVEGLLILSELIPSVRPDLNCECLISVGNVGPQLRLDVTQLAR